MNEANQQPADQSGVGPYLQCDRHGRVRWRGDVVCGACGRVYQTQDAKKPRHAPATCTCGKKLLPTSAPTGTAKTADFTARSICFVCFRQISKQGGRVGTDRLR